MKKRSITVILFLVTIFLMGMAIYISILLREESGRSITTIKKIKASSITYTKTLEFNQPLPNKEDEISPTSEVEPTATPTPTEIILAYTNPEPTITYSATSEGILSSGPSATQTQSNNLPQSGWTQYPIAIFSIAALVIFISFIY